jgi:hypothetical protein
MALLAGRFVMPLFDRKLKRLTVLSLLVATFAATAWWLIALYVAIMNRQLTFERSAAELRAILAELRETGSSEAEQKFDEWMAINIVRGRTTKADIIAWFGSENLDLDRPERDEVQTIQYRLHGEWRWGSGAHIFFDFDPTTGLLRDWSKSSWICGFCPHILAHDGQWRLEGKMLAGRIGSSREGPDTLLLPRLRPQNRRLRIRLANWAPETEYLDRVQLGAVPCTPDCEVDMDGEGQIHVWKETRKLEIESIPEEAGRDGWTFSLGKPESGRVIVLEARNTGEFETAMRKAVFTPGAAWPPAGLTLKFDNGVRQELQPVGTKFLRRMVVPVPPAARTLQISALDNMWFVRRTWLGQGQAARDVAWLSATTVEGGEADALALLRDRDGHRLVLAPMQEVDLGFMAPETDAENPHHRFVLRISGYYEFLSPGRESSRRK